MSARCGASHPLLAEGNVCREPAGHAGMHMAHDMCGRPEYVWDPAPDLSPAEAATVARFDAAEAAEESFGERLRDAFVIELDSLGLTDEMSCRAADYLADAALAVIRGEQP